MYSTMTNSHKKRSRESEIALLEQISTSLDTYIGDKPSPTAPTATLMTKKRSASDVSKNAAKNFLAAKTLVKSIAKACANEKVAIATAETLEEEIDPLIDSFVEEYKEKYPSLTRTMLVDGIVRNTHISKKNAYDEENSIEDDSIELKFGRIITAVDVDMSRYHEKIEAIKKSRELAASEPNEPAPKRGRKKIRGAIATSPTKEHKVKKSEGKPKGEVKEKKTPENFIVNEIVKRYAEERQKCDRLPNGLFETIVEETKKKFEMDFFDMPIAKLDKKVRYKYNMTVSKDNYNPPQNKHKMIVEEIYARYSRTKEANGGKLKAGTLEAIIEGVKLEYGLVNVKLSSLKTRVQARFTKEHPEFESNPPDQLKIGKLSEEDKHKRQLLMNEITARYIREKEAHPKKLADGTLDRIIEQTKNDLGIHEFEVPKETIRGRIHRKSPHVQTLGKESPYDAIDEPLVATINSWLSQGISVTRAQGLDLANRLLRGKGLEKDSSDQDIVLDAKWWRNFLDRNKRKLVCASTTDS